MSSACDVAVCSYCNQVYLPLYFLSFLPSFLRKKIKLLEWPGQSLDFENLWKELKKRVRRRGPSFLPCSVQGLKSDCVEELAKITPEHCMRLLSLCRKYLQAVTTYKGFLRSIKYVSESMLNVPPVSFHIIPHNLWTCMILFLCMSIALLEMVLLRKMVFNSYFTSCIYLSVEI